MILDFRKKKLEHFSSKKNYLPPTWIKSILIEKKKILFRTYRKHVEITIMLGIKNLLDIYYIVFMISN